jgi:Putative MetA-pathway of phenol degradation
MPRYIQNNLRLILLAVAFCCAAHGQGNYEVQVYGSDTVPPGRTMVELHSNFTLAGSKTTSDATLPTNHQEHETVEITQGWTNWFETGFYIFTSMGPGQGYKWVGDHIRPRVRVPESWQWPVGVSLSMEIGYQRPLFSRDTWTWEIRPIVDKQLGPWYLSFNPSLERSWHGPAVSQGVEFSPNFKASYQVNKRVAAGLEYYGSLGNIIGFDPVAEQQQQIVPALDFDFGPDWEFNFGVGVGLTRSTDHLLIKMILGRRFRFTTPRLPHFAKIFPSSGS